MIAMITCYTISRLLNVDYVGESGFIVYSRRSAINACFKSNYAFEKC